MPDRFIKNSKEYIIVPYSNDKRWVVLICSDHHCTPKFPFTSKKEAEKWITEVES